MPTLPTYDSTRKISTDLNTQPRAIIRNDAGQTEAITSKTLGAVQEGLMKWQGAVDSMQETAVKAGIAETHAQVLSSAAADTDINGDTAKIQELQKSKDELLKGITSPYLKQQMAIELDHQNNMATIKIKGIYNEKKLLNDNLNTEKLLMNYATNRSAENDVLAFNLIQGKVAGGFYTTHQGSELWKKYRLGSVDVDIQSDPSTTQESPVLKELILGDKGRYKDLSATERADKIKDTKINIWRNKNSAEKLEKETKTQGALDMSNALVEKTLTLSGIDKLRKAETIDIKTAAIWESALDPKQQDVEAPAGKEAILTDYLLKSFKDEKMTALDILTSATKLRGKTGFDDNAYAFVVQEVAKKFDREKKELSGLDIATQTFLNGVKGISNFALNMFQLNSGQVSDKMVNKLIEKTTSGENPEDAVKQIQKETVLEYHPQAVTYPEEGRLTLDALGNAKIIKPDGTMEDFKTKSKTETK